MSGKLTRQGVRDLSHIKGKSVGRKLDAPPSDMETFCKHERQHQIHSGDTLCPDCKRLLDWNGNPY